jgi:OFA family oxalate/formate antiporter-like MFS transporter
VNTPELNLKGGHRLFYGYIVAAAALLLIILDYGSRLTIGVFFKPILNEFGWSRALISGAVTLSMLGQGTGAIVMGRLNDKHGPRFVMTLCGCLLGAGYLLMAMVHSAWQLYIFYGVIVGLGMSGVFTSLLSTVARWFTERRGLMAGIVSAGTGIGQLIAPPVTNWLISIYDWRPSYIILGGVVLVFGVLLAQWLKRDPGRTGPVPDTNDRTKKIQPGPDGPGLPISRVVHTRPYWLMMVTFFSLGYVLMAINTHLVPHMTDLHISPAVAANIFAVCGICSAIGCIALGNAADKLGNRRSLIIYFFIMAAVLFWLTRLSTALSFVLFAIFFGLSSGGSVPIESTIIIDLFGIKSHGAILGTITLGFACGGALGPYLTGYLFDLTGSYQSGFLVCAIIACAGLISSSFLRPMNRAELIGDY